MTDNPYDFRGRTALVTGAASGIGLATARWLERHGIAELILVDLDAEQLEREEWRCENRCFGGDVGEAALWERIGGELHQIDYAVLNAGIAGCGKPIAETSFAEWRRTMATNLDGVFLGLNLAMPIMARTGGGAVVITASVAAVRAVATGDYGASKAAAAHLARIAAREGGPQGIRVNAIAPGGVDTPIWDGTETFRKQVERFGSRAEAIREFGKLGCPIGRFATADEIAGQIGFLLSDMAATITGHVLVSDGGFSL
jgi:NAD(P)-dependent dehydrogenase (short-subunit alcohol dehydrogenase family)